MDRRRRTGGTILVAAIAALCMVGLADPAAAQAARCTFRGAPEALAERPSPLDSVAIPLGDATAKLCYGRPSARGRSVVGEVEPFGTPWRLGANEPTTLHLPVPARVGGVALAAGSYSLYAIPEQDAWTIVVNGNTNRWGIPIGPDVRTADLGSFPVRTARTASHVETLSFRWEGSGSSGALVYEWENTTFRIPISR